MPFDAAPTKQCSTCGSVKSVEEFYKDRSRKGGLQSQCRVCCREYKRKYYEANSEKIHEANRKWCEANPDKNRERKRKWQKANPEKCRESRRKYREANPEKCRECEHKWAKANPEKVRERGRRYKRKKAMELSTRVRRIVPIIIHFEGRHDTLERLGSILAKRKDFDDLCYLSSDIEWLNVHYVAKEELIT